MYFSQRAVDEALKHLESVHPFYGLTFLVFKVGRLPVGKPIEVPINHEEQRFLETYYKPDRDSTYYFRVFRISDKSKYWLEADYPSSGSQSTRTRKFGQAFIHTTGTDIWAWQENYVQVLRVHLNRNRLIPAFYLAIWLYRERDWTVGIPAEEIVRTFLREFNISDEEEQALFDVAVPSGIGSNELFHREPFDWESLRARLRIPAPPDAPPEEGGALSFLRLQGIGPAKDLELAPAERINLITGDNGLGKSFLLEIIWWALSGQWAGTPAFPRRDVNRNEPRIVFHITGRRGIYKEGISEYNWQRQSWPTPKGRPTVPGLLIYARVDGGFAVWDPAKAEEPSAGPGERGTGSSPVVFDRRDVWDGLRAQIGDKTRFLSNGLISDWVTWQNNPSTYPFETLRKVLRRLSPPDLDRGDLGPLEPGDPVRIPGDSRMMPTIRHSYGEEPLIYASAGVRRIIALAYLIVWAWQEHKTQRELSRREPMRKMVILIDEIEAHLHPQWQRKIVPRVMSKISITN